ncbi:hypothetical protein GETHLI_18450 [Geothrix limicola]|uniref:histidine kinase n=1 Tax=Geothrix limicola TaxID=2927978 RepID=A0ABQ5QF81_9BACT|nr:PAS domain-containing hybrid sensor histidine kinase/response regulator [Geothrix limicola]GLH73343.1 hypothetical protein GETHLI_18450 [Geothrix limicola]
MLHPLLQQQLKGTGLDVGSGPEALQRLLESVSQSYAEADLDRAALRQSLAQSSEEMDGLLVELKRISESRIAESEQRLRAVMETVQEVIFHTNARGEWVFLNPAWEELTGFTVAETLGTFYLDAVLPEDREAAKAEVVASLRDPTREARRAVRFRSKTGYRWLEVHARPLIDADGLITGASGTLNDIHDRRQAEEEIQRQQRLLSSLLDTLPISIFLKDAEGRFLFVNQETCRTLGLPAEAITGRTDADIFPPEKAARHRAEDLRVWETGTLITSEDPFESPTGTRWFLVGKTLIQAHSRNEPTLLGFSLDITSRKWAEDELRKAKEQAEAATRAKSDFLANMSHEIRTPMNGVLGMIGFLLDTPLNPDQREHAETVHACASGLLEIINDILDFSKIEAGKLDLEILDFDLRDCVDEVLAMFADQAEAKGLDLACFLDPAIPASLRGDPGRIRQILINLVGNAIKFTGAGSVILRARAGAREGDHLELAFTLEDTGIGIPEDAQARLFSPFSQADGSMTRRFGGTGLGLAICRQLLTLLGGDIRVDSRPGAGSTFHFSLRLEVDPLARPRPNRLRGASVLWVGPPSATRDTMVAQMEAMGLVPTVRSTAAGLNPSAFQIVILEEEAPSSWPVHPPTCLRVVPWSLPTRHTLSAAQLVRPIRQRPFLAALEGALGFTPEALPAEPAAAEPLALPRQGRMLVVEDNAVNQKVAVRYLERLGYRVDVAANGLEALEACARLPYDLIFMDCQMPEMDGFEATAALRAREDGHAARRIPIIALTAHAMAGERARCLAAGMDDYLTKPLRLDELTRVIQHWMQEPAMCTPSKGDANAFDGDAANLLDLMTLQNLVDLDDGGSGLLSEMITIFREDTPRRIQDILQAAARGNALEFSHAGHALKGGAGALGAHAMRSFAADLEALGRSGSTDAGLDLSRRLEDLFQSSLAALDAYVASLPARP